MALKISRVKALSVALCVLSPLLAAQPVYAGTEEIKPNPASCEYTLTTEASGNTGGSQNLKPKLPQNPQQIVMGRKEFKAFLSKCVVGWVDQRLKSDSPGVSLFGVDIVILPYDSKVFVGQGGNPALYVHQRTRPSVIEAWNDALSDFADGNPSEYVQANVSRGKTVLFREEKVYEVHGGHFMREFGTITHEYGHAFSEMTGKPNTEGNAYIFELSMIRDAISLDYLASKKVTFGDLKEYLKDRIGNYVKSPLEDRQLIWNRLSQIQGSLSHMEGADSTVTSTFHAFQAALLKGQ